MPSFKEVQYYLAGLWLLIRMDQRGFRYLDISDRGVLRSFWAILWCIPPIGISWLWSERAYLAAMPPESSVGPAFFFRLGLVEAASWVVPLVLAGFMLLLFRTGEKFAPIVVIVNWLGLPLSYLNALLIAFVTFVPVSDDITHILSLLLMALVIFVTVRLLRMIFGAYPLFIGALTLVMMVPSMVLTDFLQRFLDIYPPS